MYAEQAFQIRSLNQVDHDINVAACRLGIRASLMCRIHQSLCDFTIESRQAYVEAGLKEESSARRSKVHFCIDCPISRESDLHFVGRYPHCTNETCRPARAEYCS